MIGAAAIKVIFHRKGLTLVAVVSAILYAVSYLIFTGAIFYFPNGLPGIIRIKAPSFEISSKGLSFIPTEYFAGSITYEAFLFLAITSSLFGILVSLFLLNRQLHTSCKYSTVGILGIVPALMTTFSCCGGGILLFLLGQTFFNALTLNSQYFLYTSTVLMLCGTIIFAKRTDEQIKLRVSSRL